jgi:hypothetical protein
MEYKTKSFIRDKYAELTQMMSTHDYDNTVLALTIIEKNATKNDLAYLLMLYKNKGPVTSITWTDHAPKVMAFIGTANYATYSSLLTFISQAKMKEVYKEDGLKFVIKELNKDILKALRQTGYDFIKSITTEIEFDNDKQQTEQ